MAERFCLSVISRSEIGSRNAVLAQKFLHPHHVVPAVKFISALVKLPYQTVSAFLMESHAVIGEIFILPLGVGDAGLQVQNMLLFQPIFQLPVKLPADAAALSVFGDID